VDGWVPSEYEVGEQVDLNNTFVLYGDQKVLAEPKIFAPKSYLNWVELAVAVFGRFLIYIPLNLNLI